MQVDIGEQERGNLGNKNTRHGVHRRCRVFSLQKVWFYDMMMVPLLRCEGADCIVGGHAFLSRIADSSCTWNEAEVPGGNFFGSILPGALKAKGGMSDDVV